MSIRRALACALFAVCVGATWLGPSAFAQGRGAAATVPLPVTALPVSKEILVMERSATQPDQVVVYEEVTLRKAPAASWTVPLPYGAFDIRPQSTGVVERGGIYVAPKGSAAVSVTYALGARLGDVFAQSLAVPQGQLAVLAGAGVYPGVGTGLTLHGQTEIGGKTFVVFTGGTQGPTPTVHFSLTAGHPGRPWSDALDVLLVIWIALGAYAGIQYLIGPIARGRTSHAGDDAA